MGWIQPLSKVQHGTANTKTKGTPLIILFLCPGVYRVFRFRFRFRFWRCLGFSFLLPLFVGKPERKRNRQQNLERKRKAATNWKATWKMKFSLLPKGA